MSDFGKLGGKRVSDALLEAEGFLTGKEAGLLFGGLPIGYLSKCGGTKRVTTDNHKNRHSCSYPVRICFVSQVQRVTAVITVKQPWFHPIFLSCFNRLFIKKPSACQQPQGTLSAKAPRNIHSHHNRRLQSVSFPLFSCNSYFPSCCSNGGLLTMTSSLRAWVRARWPTVHLRCNLNLTCVGGKNIPVHFIHGCWVEDCNRCVFLSHTSTRGQSLSPKQTHHTSYSGQDSTGTGFGNDLGWEWQFSFSSDE